MKTRKTIRARLCGAAIGIGLLLPPLCLIEACGDGSTSPEAPGDAIDLQLGQTRAFGASGTSTVHVIGGASGSEYTLVLWYPPGPSPDINFQISGEDLTTVAGPPEPERVEPLLASRVSLTTKSAPAPVELRLREYERENLSSQIAAARALATIPRAANAVVPALGDELMLNVSLDACGPPTLHAGRVTKVTDHAVFVEDEANPTGGFTVADYDAIANAYETIVYPVLTENFGAATDIDNNGGRTILFFTRAVNELTPAGRDDNLASFFFVRDLIPKSTGSSPCAGSNEAELLYLEAPDPTGSINGHVRETNQMRDFAPDNIAHSGQFLINAGRRLYVTHASIELPWLGEALSDIAEELAFYRASGLSPRKNITLGDILGNDAAHAAVNLYQIDNLIRLQNYLAASESFSPLATPPGLESSGAAWQLLRYAVDRSGRDEATFWRSLVDSKLVGAANLAAATGLDMEKLIQDWAVAQYTDDAGFPVDPTLQEASWNFRSVLPGIHNNLGFSLETHALTGGSAVAVTLKQGGASYVRFGVPAGRFASIRLASTNSAASIVTATLVRTK